MKRRTRKKNSKSSQFFIEALTKPGSLIDSYTSRVRILARCSMFVRFWSQSTCYSSNMNVDPIGFVFIINENYDVISHLHNYPHYMWIWSQMLWIQPQHHHIIVGYHVMIVTPCHYCLLSWRSVLNILVTMRSRREWKTIGVAAKLLCRVLHWLHLMCSLHCGCWYGQVVSYCISIYVQKLYFLNCPQCLHHFISQIYMNYRIIV